jgi:hypothetical protein
MQGLPPETLRIASQTLNYLENNAQPIIHPGDEFLTSFVKEDTHQSIMDQIRETQPEDETIEDLREVIDIEEEQDEEQEDTPTPQLYSRLLSDKERRKLEKVQAEADKDAEKMKKRIELEMMKAEREKEKVDRKMKTVVEKLRPIEMSGSAEG